jgi:hypothetical protein
LVSQKVEMEEIKNKITYHLWNDGFVDAEMIFAIHPEFLELDHSEIFHGMQELLDAGMTEREMRNWLYQTCSDIDEGKIKFELE